MKTKMTVMACSLVVAVTATAQLTVDWDRIIHWTGSGNKRAAIGIQFNDGWATETYVWGYRWDGDAPTARDILHAIAAEGTGLYILEQQTSAAPDRYTLAGMAFASGGMVLNDIYFDFQGALDDPKLNYNYFAGNGPGDDMPRICSEAVASAEGNGIIVHPVNARDYAQPAYDYDHWHMNGVSAQRHWNSGWSTGNWVCWTGSAATPDYTYSGMNYSTRPVQAEEVMVWNFNRHDCYRDPDGSIDGYTGASRPMRPANYQHTMENSIRNVASTAGNHSLFSLHGQPAPLRPAPGIYIMCDRNGKSKKTIIR